MSRRSARFCAFGLFFFAVAGFWLPVFSHSSQSAQQTSKTEILLQVIVVRTADEAQTILDRLKKGEDFTQLAREKSIDPTADQGGYMGESNPTELRAELRDALREVAPGQVSPIARIPSGYAILKVMERGGSGPVKGVDAARNFALSVRGAQLPRRLLLLSRRPFWVKRYVLAR
jgi:parvulin-like peptidyl-prolyl isomerase